MIKHLYANEKSMESSIEAIVCSELDVNRLKINNFLEIKNEEENAKYLCQRIVSSK